VESEYRPSPPAHQLLFQKDSTDAAPACRHGQTSLTCPTWRAECNGGCIEPPFVTRPDY
jgi:hypothetical protein